MKANEMQPKESMESSDEEPARLRLVREALRSERPAVRFMTTSNASADAGRARGAID